MRASRGKEAKKKDNKPFAAPRIEEKTWREQESKNLSY
jgi:hypothetical protein